MTGLTAALYAAILLLMIDSIIELSFISSMVSYLHQVSNDTLSFGGGIASMAYLPKNLSLNQGHTSNGASGTAFVLIGSGGLLSLALRRRTGFTIRNAPYHLWLALNIPAFLLTMGALIYVFVVTKKSEGHNIDIAAINPLNGAKYPLDSWTPQTWFSAVLRAQPDNTGGIAKHLRIMRGWEYNLIPFFIIQLGETIIAIAEYLQWRRGEHVGMVRDGQPMKERNGVNEQADPHRRFESAFD